MTTPTDTPARIPGMRAAAPTVFVATPKGLAIIDTVAVDRAINGAPAALTSDEARMAAHLALTHGLARDVVAARVGVCERTLDRWFPTEKPRTPVVCGTRQGYDRHKRRKEDACGRCKAAYALAYRHYRTHGTYVGAPALTDTEWETAA
ncbi:hypothetical protein ACFZAV_42770 [Streptomyces sp. NPDC008343]|uniref:hypothetical protein n=1 Tax=Streptomyces sp. NPDC008343 TaxID=3364828 RepID=UPI0036E1B052